jgi:hypothetical protein
MLSIAHYVDKFTKKLSNRLWEKYWINMFSYAQSYPHIYIEIEVLVPQESVELFQSMIEQNITTKSFNY